MLVASAALCLNLSAYSQDISLEINNVTVKEAMERIKKDTGYSFVFSSKDVNTNQRISVSISDASIEEVIKQILKGQKSLNYEIQGKKIVLKRATSSSSTSTSQNKKKVSGKVVDAKGEAVIGATIMEKGTNNGTITDSEGNFSLNVTDGALLDISYIGFKQQEVKALSGKILAIVLKEDTELLDEVVVVGYGIQRKSDLTGSVSSVKSADLEKFPTSSVTEMLRGQSAGVSVTLGDPSPGGASNILIRGNRSLSSKQSPLYIVDGMIVSSINDLNSNDISSIEILKDASSQAIYGSRASNGVILVTTKRGKEGKVSIDFSSQIGIQKYERNFDMYSPQEFAELRYWAKANDGASGIGSSDNINYKAVFDDEIMYNSFINQKYTDWEDLLLTNAATSQYNLSIRGGSEKMKFLSSFGYVNQNGLIKGTGYKRGNFRLNFDYSPCKWLDWGVNVTFTRSNQEKKDGSFYQIVTMSPLSQAYDDNGDLRREVNMDGDINPLWKNKEYFNEGNGDYFTASSNFTLKPFKDFSYRFNVHLRTNNNESGSYKTKLFPDSTGQGSIKNYNRSFYQIENIINYNIPFKNKDHNLQLTFIQSVDQDLQKETQLKFNNSTTDMFKWNIVDDSEITSVNRQINRKRSFSLAGRLQYNLKDKYLLTASIRRDGASVFGEKNKWANFPSLALAWRLNNERFLKDIKWIDMLKLRISYGVVGNWAIPSYRTLGLASSYEYLFGETLGIGYLPSSELLNRDLKWETTYSMNYGFDFSFLKGRINGSIEYYKTKTKDLLIQRTVPSISGYSTMWDNLGETQSSGFEFTLSSSLVKSEDFNWDAGFSISTQKNKIVKIDGRLDGEGKPINDLSNYWFIGESINVDYAYVFNGIWQKGEEPNQNQYLEGDAKPVPGDIKLLDYNGDGKITTDDKKVYNLDPSFYGSIFTKAAYKGIDLGVEFYFVGGVTKYNPFMYDYDYGGSLNGKKNGIKVNYWTPNNPSNEAPRPQYSASVPYFGTLAYQDASYFRLRSLTLGYTFPKALTTKVMIQNARIFATATNLFTITDFKSYSPEKTAATYPEAKSFIFGLNLSF